MKKIFLFPLFISLFLIALHSAIPQEMILPDYVKTNNSVYTETSDSKINTTPHTRVGSGYIYHEFTHKADYYNGQIYLCVDTTCKYHMIPETFEYEDPHWQYTTYNVTCSNGLILDEKNKIATCIQLDEVLQKDVNISYNYTNGNTVYWIKKDYKQYRISNLPFTEIDMNFDGKNKCYFFETVALQKNEAFKTRMRVHVPFIPIGTSEENSTCKYDVGYVGDGIKDFYYAYQNNKLFVNDPWDQGTSGCDASYYLNESTGSTAYDAHSSDDATCTGHSLIVDGKFDRAYSFNDDYCDINKQVFGTAGDFSISAWIRKDGSTHDTIVAQYAGGNNRFLFMTFDTNNRLYVQFSGGACCGITSGVDGEIGPNQNNWTHVAMARDRSANRVEMWVNGTLVSNTTSCNCDIEATDTFFGAEDNSPGLGMQGDIDELSLWDRKIKGYEAEALYENGQGRIYSWESAYGEGGGGDSCTYSGSGDWTIDQDCTISDDNDLMNNSIYVETGNVVYFEANQTNTSGIYPLGNAKIFFVGTAGGGGGGGPL